MKCNHHFLGSILAIFLSALLPNYVFSQVKWHSDYGGYSIQSSGTTFSFRNDGTSQTYQRIGNSGFYSDNVGTTGSSLYMPSGRYDNYSNPSRGWYGSGFIPYADPSSTTYDRTYAERTTTQPRYRIERDGDDLISQPLIEGTSLRDYSKSGYRIETRNGKSFAYPTLPGTSIRDYSVDPIQLPTSLETMPTPDSSPTHRARAGSTPPLTRSSASTASAVASDSSYDLGQRQSKSESLKRLGYNFPPDKHSWTELYDFEQRILKSQAIAKLGVKKDWEKHTWSELYDIEQRITKSKQITQLGVNLPWEEYTWSELYDAESRIRKAKELEGMGKRVNWRDYDFVTLMEMSAQARDSRVRK